MEQKKEIKQIPFKAMWSSNLDKKAILDEKIELNDSN
jgi:hypothetical protein